MSRNHTREIRRFVRAHMPDVAFRENPRLAWHLPVHFAVIAACCYAIRFVPIWATPLLGLIIGNSMTSLVCLGHAVSHNSVVRGRWRAPLESLVWASALLPAIPWRRSHNDVHHRETNTEKDFFRYFHTGEDTFAHRVVTLLFYPNKYLRWNPLVPFIFLVLQVSLIGAGMILPKDKEIPWIANRVHMRGWRDNLRFLVEMGMVLGILLIYRTAAGGGGWAFTITMFSGAYVAVALGMGYIYTQHGLHKIAPHHDPVPYTTSIYVPRAFDRMHLHMSCHVAHHLFESMNPDYHPEVEALVAENFPEVYQRLPVREAVRRLMNNELFAEPDWQEAVPEYIPHEHEISDAFHAA